MSRLLPPLIALLLLASHVASAQSTHVYLLDQSRSQVNTAITNQRASGRELVDIERRRSPAGVLSFDLIFAPLPGSSQVSAVIDVDVTQYDSFRADIQARQGRVLDVEVDDDQGVWHFSVLFWESGESGITHEFLTRRTRSDFRALLEARARSQRRLIDIEVATHDGALYFSGVWQGHARQPRSVLYQDLLWTDVNALIASADPRYTAGRILDVERYLDPDDMVERFALLVAPVPAGGERYSRTINRATLDNAHASTANGSTHLIDVDRYYGNGNLRYDALWGPGVAALVDVAPIRDDDTPLSRGSALDDHIGAVDSGLPRSNVLGVFGLNLQTRQSVGWRQDDFFPLASLVKLAIATRLYRDAGLGLINPDTVTEPFTLGASRFDNWWVDNRGAPGHGCNDRGQSFTLADYARGMMTVSDNGATGNLLRRNGGLARQSFSINDWMAGLDGIAQGWGPIVSINELDRLVAWRGQWCGAGKCGVWRPESSCQSEPAHPLAATSSLLSAPTWAISLSSRGAVNSCGTDPQQALTDHFAPAPVPVRCHDDGREQIHDSGLNSATPRAVVLMYEALLNQQLVSGSRLPDLFAAMGESDVLRRHNQFPPVDEMYSKGGTQGNASTGTHAVTDSGLFRIGDDWYAMSVLGKHLNIDQSLLRCTAVGASCDYLLIGLETLRRMAPDLRQASTPAQWLSANTVLRGDQVQARLRVRNEGGGNADGFRVSLHFSSDQQISSSDPLLGVLDTTALSAGQERTLTITGTVPASIASGSYYVGWLLDTPMNGQVLTMPNGQVGEWDESAASNRGTIAGLQVSVAASPDLLWANGFE